jgi:hypothetical protein
MHIGDMAAFYDPSLLRFRHIGVFWSKLLYCKEPFLIVPPPSLVDIFFALSICTSGLQSTNILMHIGDMVAFYDPSLWSFDNTGIFWSKLLYCED